MGEKIKTTKEWLYSVDIAYLDGITKDETFLEGEQLKEARKILRIRKLKNIEKYETE